MITVELRDHHILLIAFADSVETMREVKPQGGAVFLLHRQRHARIAFLPQEFQHRGQQTGASPLASVFRKQGDGK